MAYDYYKPAQPADLSQQFHDYSTSVPGAGFAAAAHALRESLDRAAARRDRSREITEGRAFEDRQRKEQNLYNEALAEKARLQREKDRIEEQAFTRLENEKNRGLQLGLHMMDSFSEQSRANAQARARVQEDQRKAQDTADRQTARTITQSFVASEKSNPKSSVFYRKKVSPAEVLYTNQGEDELVSTYMGANAAARPYLDEKNTTQIKALVKQAMQGRELIFQRPEQLQSFRQAIINQVTQSTDGRLTAGVLQGIDEQLLQEFGSVPSSELDAAKALDDEVRTRMKDIFGTTAPSAQQTQQLQDKTIGAAAARDPQPFTIAPGDFSDDFLARVAGSPTRAEQLKQSLFSGAIGETGLSPKVVPVQRDDGSLYLAIDAGAGQIDPVMRAKLELVLNQEGPMRDRLIARAQLGEQDATDSELGKINKAAGGSPRPGEAVQPGAPAQPAGVPVGGSLLRYLNGVPKK